MSRNKGDIAKIAFGFVLIIGIVNLFADMTYEGARSITGPFLGSLGASATVVGVVAGTGELLGYSLRSVAGYFADKTQRYWLSAQNSLLKALLTEVLSAAKRSTGFGLFYTGYGIAWFLGSAVMGLLYDKSILALVIFSVVLQFLALPVFFLARRRSQNPASS